MAYVILAVLLLVAAALAIRPFLTEPPGPAEAAEEETGRSGYREDIHQDFLMGKMAPEEYEAALNEEGEE